MTFTNKAAAEMRERVKRLLGFECGHLWISTFHSLCARLLRREAPTLGLSRHFVIYDSTDQLAVVRRAIRDLGLDDKLLPPKAVLARISSAKNRMQDPGDLAASGWGPFEERVAQVYARYIRALADASALDFDDLLLKTVELFETSERVCTKYAQQFKYVLVDEYQDTNRPQYLLVRRLAEAHRNLCVVGDPDQSIYKWRGADLRNIMAFEEDFPETKVVRLERNYRSTQVILDAASAVISQNRNRKEKRLWTERQGGARITYYRAGDELEEADFIAATARRATDEDLETELAVLYRTNAQSRAIEDALLRQAVAYRIIGGVRFYERKEIKDTLAYLKLAINPHDDVSLRRVINAPARGIGKGVLGALDRIDPDGAPLLAAASGPSPASAPPSLWTRLGRAVDERLVPSRAHKSLTAFRTLIHKLADVARREPASATVETMLDRSGYLQDLENEQERGGAGTDREPAGSRLGGARVRSAGRRAVAGRLRRSPLAPIGDRRGRRSLCSTQLVKVTPWVGSWPEHLLVAVDRGHAIELDGRIAVWLQRVNEGASLDPGAGNRSAPEHQIVQTVRQHAPAAILAEIAIGAIGGGDQRNLVMIMQVRADAGRVHQNIDAVLLEVIARPDPGKHQELWRYEGTCREYDRALSAGGPHLALLMVVDAGRALAVEQNLGDLGVGLEVQLRVLFHRIEKGPDRTAARPRKCGRLHEADASLIATIEIVDQANPLGLQRLQIDVAHLRNMHGIGNLEWAVDAMRLAVQALIGLLALEERQHAAIAPAGIAARDLVPMVVVGRPAAHIDHGVDRTAAAQDVALPDGNRAPAEVLLRHGLMLGQERAAVQELEESRRHSDQRMIVLAAGLKQQHARAVLADQAVGGDASRRSAANDDIVINAGCRRLVHVILPGRFSADRAGAFSPLSRS